MLRRILLCSAVAVGTVVISAPSASAEDICVTVTVTAPVHRIEERCAPYFYDSDCATTGLNMYPFLSYAVKYCGPAATFMPPVEE